MSHPTPWFLKEEPVRGKPSPEKLELYKAYLRTQLRRGVSVWRKSKGATTEHGTPGQNRLLRIMAEVGRPVHIRELMELYGADKSTVGFFLRELKRRGHVTLNGSTGNIHSTYSLTPEGWERARQMRGESA